MTARKSAAPSARKAAEAPLAGLGKTLKVRVSLEQFAEIKRRADARGVKTSTLVRERVLAGYTPANPHRRTARQMPADVGETTRALVQLGRQMRAHGHLINQIAAALHSRDTVPNDQILAAIEASRQQQEVAAALHTRTIAAVTNLGPLEEGEDDGAETAAGD